MALGRPEPRFQILYAQMISNPRHGSPPRLMAHQATRFAAAQESRPSPSTGIRMKRILGLEPEQANRCEEEWGEPASQGFEPGSGVIWSPECLGYWGDRYLWPEHA